MPPALPFLRLIEEPGMIEQAFLAL